MFFSSLVHCPQWLFHIKPSLHCGERLWEKKKKRLPFGSFHLRARRSFPSEPLLASLWSELGHIAIEPVIYKGDEKVFGVLGTLGFLGHFLPSLCTHFIFLKYKLKHVYQCFKL